MDNQNGNKDNNKNNKQGFSFVILITMLTALLVFAMYQFQGVDSDQEITYNKFLKMIDEKKVEKVEIKSDRILITAKKESGDKVNKEYYTGRMINWWRNWKKQRLISIRRYRIQLLQLLPSML